MTITMGYCDLSEIQEIVHIFLIEARASFIVYLIAVVAIPVSIAKAPTFSALSIHARAAVSIRAHSWIADITIVARPAKITLGASGVRPASNAGVTFGARPLVIANAPSVSAVSIRAPIRITLITILAHPALFTFGAKEAHPMINASTPSVSTVSMQAHTRIALVTIDARPAIFTLSARGAHKVKIALASIINADSIHARTRNALFTTVTHPTIIANAPITSAVSMTTCVWAGK
jgi:hypothetical protein